MTVLNDTKIVIPTAAQRNLIYIDVDAQLGEDNLWSKNVTAGKNDVWLRNIIEKYPELLDKLIREVAESKPYVSVVLPVRNVANITTQLQNIFLQRFPDFELILINCGAQVQVPTLPTNFHVINYPGSTVKDALNLGLEKSAGEYILFKDETSFLLQDGLEIVAEIIALSQADVIHFAGHIQLDGTGSSKFISDNAPELEIGKMIFFDAPKQLRASMWLKNKLSKRLDTKFFRKNFLTQYKMKFGDDVLEFLFCALIQAEKYLLAPQTFCITK